MDCIHKSDCYMGSGQAHSQDGRLMLHGDSLFLLRIVPDDDFRLRPTWVLASSDQSKIVVVAEHFSYACPWVSREWWVADHFDNTNAGIEKPRYLESTWLTAEYTEACVCSDAEARDVAVKRCAERDGAVGLIDNRAGIHGWCCCWVQLA